MSAFENVELPMTILGKLSKKVVPRTEHRPVRVTGLLYRYIMAANPSTGQSGPIFLRDSTAEARLRPAYAARLLMESAGWVATARNVAPHDESELVRSGQHWSY